MRGVIILLFLGLAACNDKPPERNVFSDQLDLKKKAAAVEVQVQQGAARRAAEVEQAEK
jgi:hypothetical protein